MPEPKVDKRKTPENLARLAEMRIKAAEARRKRGQISKVKKEEKKAAFEKEYEAVVLKKQPNAVKKTEQPIAEEATDKEVYENQTTAEIESEDEEPQYVPKVKAKSSQRAPSYKEPNYKQDYYRHKLSMLQQQHEQATFANQYSQLPPQQHVVDIARNQLKTKVDKEIMNRVWNELFSG